MSNSDIIFCSHSPWSGVSSSLFILYRWFYAWYILVNRVCLGRITNLALYTCCIISYTSFPMINCYSLIIDSFIAFFSSSWVISCTHGGLILQGGSTVLWSSFFRHGVSDPGSFRFMFIGVDLEFSSLVLQNKSYPYFLVGSCIWPFLQGKCTSCMVRNIS